MPSRSPAAEPSGPSDESLALRSREGDLASFEALARRYEDRLYGYALRMLGDLHEAADATQDVLMRTFRSLGNFDPRQRFGAWVFGIAAHVCRDCLRSRRRRPEHLGEWVEDPLASGDGTEGAVRAEESRRVHEAIARLPLKYREVIVLHYLEDMGYEEVARSLGITAAGARRRALRARDMLRRHLGEVGRGSTHVGR